MFPLRKVNGPRKVQRPCAASPFTSMRGLKTLCCEKLMRSAKPLASFRMSACPCARQSPFPSQMPSSAKIATIRSGLWASSQMSQYSAFSLLIASMSWRTVRRFSSSALSMSATLLRRRHGIQKESRVFNEQLWVLVVRAMIGVGVDDQLRIRHVLLHDERVHRGYVHVVTAVHDECWLLDRLQIVVGPLLPDAPLANRFDLGGRHLVVHFRIAPNLTKMRALQELASRRLACRGRTEFDREPDILGRIIGGAKEPPCCLGYQLHSLTAARTCAIDDQPANEIGRLQSDFLRDHAADREAKYVHLVQTKCSGEGDRVGAHLLERRRDLAGAAGDARVVEQDHLTVAGQAIRHRWVPIIHGTDVVLVKDERHSAGLAESAIGETDAVGLYELCRRGLVCVVIHNKSPCGGSHGISQPAPHRVRAPGLRSRNRRRSAPWAPRSARSPRQLLRSP